MSDRRKSAASSHSFWRDLPNVPFRYLAIVIYRIGGRRRLSDVRDWSERVRLDLGWRAAPALLCCALGILFVLLTVANPQRKYAATYIAAAESALQSEDYDTAVVCLCRLASEAPTTAAFRYKLATAFDARHETLRATSLMREIAPEDHLGFPAAHLWLTRKMLARPTPPSPTELLQAERHLILLKGSGDYARQAAEQLAEIYLRTERAAKVAHDPTLLDAALSVPELQLLVLKYRFGRATGTDFDRQLAKLLATLRADLTKQPENDEARRRLVTALLLAGDHQGAYYVLEEGMTLRPDGPFGLLAAKAAAARALDAERRVEVSKQKREQLAAQAFILIEKYGTPGDEKELTAARLLRSLGRVDEAVARYRPIVARSTTARMELAALLRSAGRTQEAAVELEQVLRWYHSPPPNLEPEPLLPLHAAAAVVRLGRPHEAIEILDSDYDEISPDLKRAALIEAYTAWDDLLKSQSPELTTLKRLEILTSAMKVDPWNPQVLRRLLDLSHGDNPAAEGTREYLQRRITMGDVTAQAYLILGTDSMTRGDRTAARSYLEQAYRLDPELIPTLFGLARLLAEDAQDEADNERALRLLDAAVAKTPNDFEVRYLRGRVQLSLKLWQQALADLEFCSARKYGDPEFHRAIAAAYSNLNLPELAEKHQRLAASTTGVK